MKPETFRNIFFWLVMALVIGLAIWLIIFINGESYSCINSPYIYSMKLLEKSNKANITCSCMIYKVPSVSFTWTDQGLKTDNEDFAYPSMHLNQVNYTKN